MMTPESKAKIEELLAGFPPLVESSYFGLDMPWEEAEVVLIPVPWDVTTSYSDGTHRAPEDIRRASHQLDAQDPLFGIPLLSGIATREIPWDVLKMNHELRPKAEEVIATWERGEDPMGGAHLEAINAASQKLTSSLRDLSQELLAQDKLVAVLGGDHSTPLGLIQALDCQKEPFSILHIDAHHDLRVAYEGFKESHASIMYNALESCPHLEKLVSVGIRDYSQDEKELAASDKRIVTFYDHLLAERSLSGDSFKDIAQDILAPLGKRVYISCDIDGLSPVYCPATGTPVPGGLSFRELTYLFKQLSLSGRTIVGFDLCEVGGNESNEWDANVGARVLYALCGAALSSRKI